MRRWLICVTLALTAALIATPTAAASPCEVIYIHRPDGQPPIEIEVCP